MIGRCSTGCLVRDALKLKFEKFISRSTPFQLKSDFKSLHFLSFLQFDGGRAILSEFRTFSTFYPTLYPHFRWTLFDVDHVSKNSWNSEYFAKYYLELISLQIPGKINSLNDFRNLDWEFVKNFHGRKLLTGNLLEILQRNFPEFFWEKIWRYPSTEGPEKKRMFIDRFLQGFFSDVQRAEQAAEIGFDEVWALPGGSTVLHAYGNSPRCAFYGTYVELRPPPEATGGEGEGRGRVCMDALVVRCFAFVQVQEDLVQINQRQLNKFSGSRSVLVQNQYSPQKAFREIYPELAPRYRTELRGYWKGGAGSYEWLKRVIKDYEVQTRWDWYNLSVEQIAEVFGKKVMKKNLWRILEMVHPEQVWERGKFSERMNRRAKQRFLGLKLREVLKKEVIFEDYGFKCGDRLVEFDFYVPGMGLVVEYQGEQHYYSVLKWVSVEEQKRRDVEKSIVCVQNGLKLIYVPYWWDCSLGSLKEKLFTKEMN